MDGLAFVALLVMAVGLAGAVIPGLPGALLAFGVAALYGIADGFDKFSPLWLLPMAALAAGALAMDLLAAPAMARRFGASKWGVIGAIAGLVVGIIIGGPFGALAGPLVGAVLAEMLFGSTLKQAFRSGIGTAVGFVVSMVAEGVAVLGIMFLFVVAIVA